MNIENIFIDAREEIGKLSKDLVSPLMTFEDLLNKVNSNSSRTLIYLLSEEKKIKELIQRYNLTYNYLGNFDYSKTNFEEIGKKSVIVPQEFKLKWDNFLDNFYQTLVDIWSNQGVVSIEMAKETFQLKIDSAFRSPAYQAYTICECSIKDENKNNSSTKTLEHILGWVALPYTSEHSILPYPAIDVNPFMPGPNFYFKTYEQIRSNLIWQLFKQIGRENGFIESYPIGSKVNFGNGEPWHFLYTEN